MEKITININSKNILIAAVVLSVVFGAFFAGKFTVAEKSDAGSQKGTNQNSAPIIPSGGGGCGV